MLFLSLKSRAEGFIWKDSSLSRDPPVLTTEDRICHGFTNGYRNIPEKTTFFHHGDTLVFSGRPSLVILVDEQYVNRYELQVCLVSLPHSLEFKAQKYLNQKFERKSSPKFFKLYFFHSLHSNESM